ncbi:MAG: hypothetical protein A2W91_05355 [Bacteroidetes bacterium GWF2_38_335]|nr:MAG: hypothetical protein A2W91_05355 [Bacteroidetes bacterium GWF2_38_335]HBS88130.1 XRE family transcriptional regulator [Bacteroidales bacterium]
MLKTPKEILTELAINAKALRRSKKISQKEMAERSGVSLGSIKRFESTGKISLESLLMVAMVLKRLPDFEKLFTVENTPGTIDELFR